ncbi:SURF1 family protein [Sphingomonas humi]|uniref:SURF1-like protein n=1 Tax=Sphingomonas humi TaxID=335630 RepID=A0ABP7RUY6_9SPHN
MTPARPKRLFLPALCALLALVFAGLGVWQVERLAWKRDLIARVEARLAAAPEELPPRASWTKLDPREIEYRRVRVRGVFDLANTTFVDALTERGAGNWVLTPLRTGEGTIIVNRGFAPKGWNDPPREAAPVEIIGLMRLSEPNGRFLRANRPGDNAWYSRDIAAIAAARGLSGVAPFFIDAAVGSPADAYPIGGMTVVHFRNAHLVYALTWFGLAALCGFGLALMVRNKHNGG